MAHLRVPSPPAGEGEAHCGSLQVPSEVTVVGEGSEDVVHLDERGDAYFEL